MLNAMLETTFLVAGSDAAQSASIESHCRCANIVINLDAIGQCEMRSNGRLRAAHLEHQPSQQFNPPKPIN